MNLFENENIAYLSLKINDLFKGETLEALAARVIGDEKTKRGEILSPKAEPFELWLA
jgi:hypothetical protein